MDQGCCKDNNWIDNCDPLKRICYQYGMLLGVEEFQQEQSYHRSKHRLNQRLFIGYGLYYGGDFSVVKRKVKDKDGKESDHLFVVIHRLFALDDLGRELWVKDQCELDLTVWWAAHKTTGAIPVQAEEKDTEACAPAPANEKTVYLTLGYKQCCTAPVPAIAPPCDDQTAPTMASRIIEGVECQLSLTAPKPPTDFAVARPADVRWSDQAMKVLADWMKAMCADESRPLLLGTLEITDTGTGLHVKKCRNHALPRLGMKSPPPFQVVSVHANLYCREPTLDVRFNLPPLVAGIDAFHVLELCPPGRRHKPHRHGGHHGEPHSGGHHHGESHHGGYHHGEPHHEGHHGGPHKGGPAKGSPAKGGYAQQSVCPAPMEDCEVEEETTAHCLSTLRELVDPRGVVCPDECDPTVLHIPLCDVPAPGSPYRIVITGTGASAVLTRGLLALNDGADFTVVFENKEPDKPSV